MGKQSEKGSMVRHKIIFSEEEKGKKFTIFFAGSTSTLTILDPIRKRIRIFGENYYSKKDLIVVGETLKIFSGRTNEDSLPIHAIKVQTYSGIRTDKPNMK